MSQANIPTETAQSGTTGGSMVATVTDEAKTLANSAGEHAGDLAGTVKEQAATVASEVTAQTSKLVTDATEQLREQANTETQRAAQRIRGYGDELQALADGRPEDAPTIRPQVERAAARANELADRIESRGPSGLIEDVSDFARRRPVVFLLGAVAAGFVAGRVIKAQKSRTESTPVERMHATPADVQRPAEPIEPIEPIDLSAPQLTDGINVKADLAHNAGPVM